MEKKQIKISEKDFMQSKYSTKEWEQSVDIIRWEHNHLTKEYIIDYKDKWATAPNICGVNDYIDAII